MNACTHYAPMIGARPGELDEAEARGFAEHLAACDACQARLADAEVLTGMLSDALMGEANRRDFTAFADGVMARLPKSREVAVSSPSPRLRGEGRGEGRRAARSDVGGWLTPIAAWVRQHRLAAVGSALVPAVAALALVLYVGRDQPPEFAVDVTSDDRGAMVLETNEGPVVLLGDSDSEGT
jgi:hypothetical protein